MFKDYLFKKEILSFFERENIDFSRYNTNLILENWPRIKKGLIAGATVAALASPYLLSHKPKKSSDVIQLDKEEEIKIFRDKNKVKQGELELFCTNSNIKKFDPSNPKHVHMFKKWREYRNTVFDPQ